MIFNLQRYSTHDGPGIRSVVFLKGCSLGCRWCQNPESRARKADLLFDPRLCLGGCTLCSEEDTQAVRRIDDNLVIQRDLLSHEDYAALAARCPTGALSLCGSAINIDDIMAEVLRDRPFYLRTGGGLTLSGGEPFMQPTVAAELLRRSREAGIHTAVESCLHTPWSYIAPSLPWLDLMLADLKHVDERRFKQWTGGSAKRVMDNFRRLAERGTQTVVRVPLIPEFNADRHSVREIVDFAADEAGAKEIHFLPYHTLGINKYPLLGEPYHAARTPLDAPDLLAYAEQYAKTKGLTAILRG
ncbi:4-hydroxyphenylacetate decarboxylase activating enzyme [Serratia quinivorans]|uniref:glycyl-radical enzyme activating protein n=1 Tax=Serratia quinivorans TaxID=137545 RepID=UPI002178CAB1|nr:glycyl-radical enzyme activating protein [Serratia quinivorans]CAI0716050.1 4-hydroxyphenylacetate decarboxylase activating enzyme [Serratia quinivorans]CAI0788122.1 4-hydroxyphenylacetate decarboxylase activating enzyme [Serratia quinivorans]CAI0805551.1 4-hydroxyphenylacetate decarboxylase activating enzyme [Serratia quinivorans]CAI1200880.1 4-hydroxyphenylacetate decarboxylase activating enzyme [Serratia quinivorans]CAI1559355.1 4-hydroxyphenylacetate decarboxylase activating enzyme [Ser